jgi:hypothetical protein
MALPYGRAFFMRTIRFMLVGYTIFLINRRKLIMLNIDIV